MLSAAVWLVFSGYFYTLRLGSFGSFPKPLTVEEERHFLACMGTKPCYMDDVIARLEQPAADAMRLMTRLSLKGFVENHPGRMVSAKVEIPER